VFLDHTYFETKQFENQTHFIKDGEAVDKYDEAVLAFLRDEGMEYKGLKVEYWFQSQTIGEQLAPHCDYNHYARSDQTFSPPQWLEEGKEKYFLSPITLATYLEVSDDMEGGELMISHTQWSEDSINPPDGIEDMPREAYNPTLYDVVYFRGSYHYHWIAPVKQGSRKSMLINFWPVDLAD
jgi:hypothetical protein